MKEDQDIEQLLSYLTTRTAIYADATGQQRKRTLRKKRSAQELLSPSTRIIATIVLACFILVPVIYLLLLSVTPDAEFNSENLFPTQWAFSNYVQMWSTVPLAQSLVNSIVVSLTASAIAVVMAVGMAYIITRFAFRGRLLYLYSLVGLQTIPSAMLLLPLFVLFASAQTTLHIKLVGTYQAIIITHLAFALPFATWLMVSYLSSIPLDLEEAARVDGATRVQALLCVIVPLALPGVVIALVFSFLTGWNDVLFASVLTSPETRTVAVQLQAFSSAQEGGSLPLYGQLMSATIVSSLPIIILYTIFQRYVVGGLTAGGVKG